MSARALLEGNLLGNDVRDWLTALVASGFIFAVLAVIRGLVSRRLKGLPAALARKTAAATFLALSAFGGIFFLELPARIDRLVESVAALALLVQGGVWVIVAATALLARKAESEREAAPGEAAMLVAAGYLLRLAVWSVVTVAALENFGVNVTALVAGLGIGGVAVALAAQNVLSDLFASVGIVLDRPFVVGDLISVDDYKGSVEKIGIKSTRVRSVSGELIVFSNSDIAKSRIRNYGMAEKAAGGGAGGDGHEQG